MQAAPVATTPEVSQPTADVGQPTQLEGGMPEGQQLQPEGQPTELTPQEELFLQASTGTVYKTREAAIAGIEAKDQYIEQLKSLLASQHQPQSQQPQVRQHDHDVAIARGHATRRRICHLGLLRGLPTQEFTNFTRVVS